jgi:uncharacterized protein (TIGR02145 family)
MELGGITWAAYNVDDYQTFAERPDMYTKFYQCNKSTAWAATGSVSGWSSSANTSSTWTVNPCPAGWRLPTREEFTALDNAGSTWAAANARGNAVAGYFYGPNHATCGLPNNMSGCVFLPAVGWRNFSDGTLLNQNTQVRYWASTQNTTTLGQSYPANETNKATGLSIRCVQ